MKRDPRKDIRLINIPRIFDATAFITTTGETNNSYEHYVEHNVRSYKYHVIPEDKRIAPDDSVYNFPFLLNHDGKPWHEANTYLFEMAINSTKLAEATDLIRDKASKLLDYKLFCEDKEIEFDDFSGRRPSHRPTYKYYAYLSSEVEIGPETLNMKTSAVYYFIKWLSEQSDSYIDIDRVDTVKDIRISFETATGRGSKKVTKRGQTKPVSHEPIPVEVGYVRDEGEDLRPLTLTQRDEFLREISKDEFSVDERLFSLFALYTGARKQTIFTLRMKHLAFFEPKFLLSDNTYELRVSSKNGADTKYDKPQKLFVEKELADDLIVYSKSRTAKARRKEFQQKFADEFPDLEKMHDNDVYLFLSTENNCHYMAKDDPRFVRVRSRPKGQRTRLFTEKLLTFTSKKFPKDITFHWLRATFAFVYYLHLVKKYEDKNGKIISHSEIIRKVQKRMHHSRSSITENYLKLFENINDKKRAQELYESHIFKGYENDLKRINTEKKQSVST
ncbi:MAG: site-specific integrase [Alteromonadaceae bacterium]|nr:site-specific integrase [Alteromonadaceae bacterium]